MSTVAGCENVSSRSAKGYGNISVAFRKGTDMEAARFEVASAIRNLYGKLPQEISYPYISLCHLRQPRIRRRWSIRSRPTCPPNASKSM